MVAKRSQPPGIGGHGVIREIAADHLSQPSPLLRNRSMHPPTQFPFKGLELDPHPIPARPAMKQEGATTDRPQICANPKKLNVSGLPRPRFSRLSAAWRPNSMRRVLSGCSDSANFFLLGLRSLPYTLKSRRHAYPAQCPVHVAPVRVSPRPPPFAPPTPHPILRTCSPGFAATVEGSDFSGSCIIGYGSSPSRWGSLPSVRMVQLEISRFPYKELPYMPGSQTTQGRSGTRTDVPDRVFFRVSYRVGTPKIITFAARWLAYTFPCRRFAVSSRIPAHGSGSMWIANPSLRRTRRTAYSLPVSRRTELLF